MAGAHTLAVRSVDQGGNKSDVLGYRFYANGPSSPDKPGDLNGDDLRRYTGLGTINVGPYTAAGTTTSPAPRCPAPPRGPHAGYELAASRSAHVPMRRPQAAGALRRSRSL